jgi:hypothetical protein
MRILLLLLIFILSPDLFSQELNIGLNAGTALQGDINKVIMLGGILEYRPLIESENNRSVVAFETNPFLLVSDKDLMLTLPVYLKFIIGNKIRFCPLIGGFARTNSNYGMLGGLNFECSVKENLMLFLSGEYYLDYYHEKYYSHFGTSSEYLASSLSLWISLGIKKRF